MCIGQVLLDSAPWKISCYTTTFQTDTENNCLIKQYSFMF